MKEIKSVIFDWGGVLIDDPAPRLMQYCAEALAVSKEDYIKAHSKFTADFQKGLISEDTFWYRICGELNIAKPKIPSLWTDAFIASYVPRENIFTIAILLQENGYKTAVLSNTEESAMRYFHQLQYNMFDVLVFSCAEGTMKPERKIYELTLERLGSQPRQSIFIDDKPEHINGAKEAGLSTILFRSIEHLKDELTRFSVKV